MSDVGPEAVPKPWAQYRYVFVVTYARSGSTLLQSLLNSSPGVQIRGENNGALFHLFRAVAAVDSTKKQFGSHPQTKQVDEPWYGASQVKPVMFERNLIASFVRNVLAPDDDTVVTGFKEIRHNRYFIAKAQFAPYVDFLLKSFPNSKVVFNTRKAADVARSGFLSEHNPHEVLSWVAETDGLFQAYAEAHPDRTILMRYDDYVADHSLVHKMMGFLGLQSSPEAVERVFGKRLNHAKKHGPAAGKAWPAPAAD